MDNIHKKARANKYYLNTRSVDVDYSITRNRNNKT
jgi:hypothetical protein